MTVTQAHRAQGIFANRLRRLLGRAGKFRKNMAHKDLFTDMMMTAGLRSYMVMPGQPVWMDRNYYQFALEAHVRNVIAHRAMGMVAGAGASVKFKLYAIGADGMRQEIKTHPVLDILRHPNPAQAHGEFFQALYQYRLISGNAFVQAVGPARQPPSELHLLRPDRMAVIAGKGCTPGGYRYTVNGQYTDYPVDRITGRSSILHIKTFHPLNDWYGLSPVEAAAYSIDQHNQSGAWNQALLQNGARPSGALVVRAESSGGGTLSEDQYNRVKLQIDDQFTGAANAGRPLLLEGGLDWKEMSLTPKDMDFVQAKNSAARDIALAFGVPPQLLGIPGDNTYANLQEARLALWEQTVVPLLKATADALNGWLVPMFGGQMELVPDTDNISALAIRNQAIWDRVQQATFLTTDEKRAAVGYGPLPKIKSNGRRGRTKIRGHHFGKDSEDGSDSSDDDGGDGDNDFADSGSGDNSDYGGVDYGGDSEDNNAADNTSDHDDALAALGVTPGVNYDNDIAKDMDKRDWTPEQIDDAQQYGNNIDAIDKETGDAATRYEHPDTGKSVVINDNTNEVVQVGGDGFRFGTESGDVPGAVMQPPNNVRPTSEGGGGGGGGSLEPLVGGSHDFTNPRPDLPDMEE